MLSILASSDLPFLVMGRAGMDLYPHPPGTRIEEATNFSAELGGSSGNIAAALSRFEQPTWLATSVSNDAVGRFVVQQLANYGIATDLLHTLDGDVRTSLALAESRIENQQTVIYRNQAADFQMSVAHIEAIDFSRFRAVVVTGTCRPSPGCQQRSEASVWAAWAPVAAWAECRALPAPRYSPSPCVYVHQKRNEVKHMFTTPP